MDWFFLVGGRSESDRPGKKKRTLTHSARRHNKVGGGDCKKGKRNRKERRESQH